MKRIQYEDNTIIIDDYCLWLVQQIAILDGEAFTAYPIDDEKYIREFDIVVDHTEDDLLEMLNARIDSTGYFISKK